MAPLLVALDDSAGLEREARPVDHRLDVDLGRLLVDATDDQGVVTSWNLELGSPNSVLRRGWTRNDLKPGDKISFTGYGGRAVLTRSVADSITLADGRPFAGASGSPER